MVELFDRNKTIVSRHIKNAFKVGEIENSVVANFATTATDRKTYHVDYYNLDIIIFVEYRIKFHRGVKIGNPK